MRTIPIAIAALTALSLCGCDSLARFTRLHVGDPVTDAGYAAILRSHLEEDDLAPSSVEALERAIELLESPTTPKADS